MTNELPVQKNETITATIEDLTHEGAGVAKVDGYTLFVPNSLPGETAEIKVIKTKKGYGFGRLINIIEESPDRVEAPCPIYKLCGGCQLQHMSYGGQKQYKHKQVVEALSRLGGLSDVTVHPTLGMEEPWHYRNKAQVPIGTKPDGHLKAGFYQQRSHRIMDMDACIIQQESNDQAVQTVKNIADELGITSYNEDKHRGTLRHVVARYAQTTGQLMIVLITKDETLSHKKKLIEKIREEIPETVSIIHNINPKRTNVIFGDQTNVLWGEEYIYDHIGDISFAISARSFYQVNPDQTKVLYDKALEYADLKGHETVVDAYCGIGTISLFLAQKAKHVHGVDIVPEAITDAKRNARINQFENVTFAVGEAEEVVPWWAKANGLRPDVMVVDPPRKGCDDKLLDMMLDTSPERIVYVSCNPATLARDLKYLTESGAYEVKEVQPVDMFPQTTHVECVTSISRIDK